MPIITSPLWVGILTALLACSRLCGQEQSEGATIRVPVRLVAVPTLVLSNEGRPIAGLKPDAFRLFDKGRPQSFSVEEDARPASVVIAIEVSRSIHDYLPFLANAGKLVEQWLRGVDGEIAVLSYNDEVSVSKPFDTGEVDATLRKLSAAGEQSRLIDAGVKGIDLLMKVPPSRSRILLFIGQPFDSGSQATLDQLKVSAERENISIFALVLPVFHKSFISETFTVNSLSSVTDKGGVRASVELTELIPALRRARESKQGTGPFSILTMATGGTQLPFHKEQQFIKDLQLIGNDLRSFYMLNFTPDDIEPGYHDLKVEVDDRNSHVHSRSGYQRR